MLPAEFIKPDYQGRCFANLPPTIEYLLTGQKTKGGLADDLLAQFQPPYQTVILFFVDAFGWNLFEKYADDYPFLQKISQNGLVARLTAQFPSTTSAHVTTIHTGLPVGQSGLYEWNQYEPQLDAIITPLLFSFAGDKERETLKSTGVSPEQIFPTQTFYRRLNRQGVTSYTFQQKDYAHSPYSKIVTDGAKLISYLTLPEALVNLNALRQEQQGPAYYFLYFNLVDAISHDYGPFSPQAQAELDTFLTVVDRLFWQKQPPGSGRTLLLMTADHGQTAVDPQTTIYLNRRFPDLKRFLKTNQEGRPLVPAGSCRDIFLHINEADLLEAQAFLTGRLTGQAEVYLTRQLIEAGLFGPQPLSDTFLDRVGNLVILPHQGQTVWWYEKDKFEQKYYGHHGGLTRDEMEIPLLAYPFSV